MAWHRHLRRWAIPSLFLCSGGHAPIGAAQAAVRSDTGPYNGIAAATSPDGRIRVCLLIGQAPGVTNGLFGSVSFDGNAVLAPSPLGFSLEDATPLRSGFQAVDVASSSHDATWRPVYGEQAEVRNHYREVLATVRDHHVPPRTLEVQLRAYDEGAAFRIRFPSQPALDRFVIAGEETRFCFTEDHWVWAVHSAQGWYKKTRLSGIGTDCERPLTLMAESGDLYLAVAEAGMVDYARMRLRRDTGWPHAAVSQLHGPVELGSPCRTPWRVLMVAERPGDLLQNNHLILNLNEPNALADASWIKPGKIMRDRTLSTANAMDMVAFAKSIGMEYIHFHDTDPSRTTVRQVAQSTVAVTSETVITADLAANGGHAMILTPSPEPSVIEAGVANR